MFRPTRVDLGIAGILLIAVFSAYSPAIQHGFIWDDDAHVTAPALQSWSGLGRIWFEIGATQQYYPVLHSAFWLEHRLWGAGPLGYHVANISLHALASILLALLLRRLAIPGAALAALVFAVHPVHVESVAWISEQKNTLSLVFYLAAALSYLRFDQERRGGMYVLASFFFVLGLLTKTVTATLPAALLVVLWWQRGCLAGRRDIRPLVPWFVVGVVAGLFTVWVERTLIGAEGALYDLNGLQRGLLAGRVGWFYFGKLLWPANLTFIYPRWSIDPRDVFAWLPLGGAVALLAVAWWIRGRWRAPLAAALFFGGSLFPVLGFFNVYPFRYSYVADHFQYVASIAVCAVAVGTLSLVVSPVTGLRVRAWYGVMGLLVVSLGCLTWQQTRIYRDNRTLFRATIARNPECWMAYNNLGKELMAAKETLPEAIAHLTRAVALRADDADVQNNLGLALTQSGRPREAVAHLETSLRLKPASYQAHNNLGIALASSGRPEEALRAFAQAASLNPAMPNIHENWAKALLLLNRRTEAEEHFAVAARLRRTRR